MSWEIKYSELAIADLGEIYEYIYYELSAPISAKRIVNKIRKEIADLGEMPYAFRRYRKEPWKSRNMRCMNVDNYLVFYIPDEDEQAVFVLRIIHGSADYENRLF